MPIMMTTTAQVTEYDVAVFEDHLMRALDPFLPAVRKWYDDYYEHVFEVVGANPIVGEDVPYGLMYRFNVTEKHSAVKGLQAYAFVNVQTLQLPPAKGGVRQMTKRILGEDWYEYGDMMLIAKQNLVQTNNAAQFIIFVPKTFYEQLPKGRYIWFTEGEMDMMFMKVIPKSVMGKLERWAGKVRRREVQRGIYRSDEALQVTLQEDWE